MKSASDTDQKAAIAEDISARNHKVTLKATDAHPHIKAGEVFDIHYAHEAKLRDNGWAVDINGETKTNGKAKKPAGAPATTEVNVSA